MIKIFIGTSANGEDQKAELVLENSIKEHTSEEVDIIWMRQSSDINSLYYGWNTSTWATPFSGLRWSIPHACNFKGKAIYLDVDMINLKDIAELYNTEMGNNALLIKKDIFRGGWLTSVMLFDCEKIKNYIPNIEVIKQWANINRPSEILKGFTGIIGELDQRWNMLDIQPLKIEDSWIIHYTAMAAQPWKPKWFKGVPKEHPRKDLTELWHNEYNKLCLNITK